MRIAVSADCFSAFTSGFPVRGMTLALIQSRPNDSFVLFYTSRPWSQNLMPFYNEINNLPNVEVRFFRDPSKIIAIKRMLGLRYVKLDEFDCFLSPGNPEYIRGYKGKQICSLADLSTIRGLNTGKYAFFFKYWNRFFLKRTLLKMDIIVAISEYTRQDIIDYCPSVANKIKVVYNGIDHFWFDDHYEENDETKRLPHKSYFVWWGLVSRRKNIANLIAAYKMARNRKENLPKLLLVGRFSEHTEYLKKELNEDIINIPFQDNYILKTLVSRSAGTLFPSLYEGFGLPVIESFSQGIPVVCSNVTSLPEISNGFSILFNPYDISQITGAIIKLSETSDNLRLVDYAKSFTYAKAAEMYSTIINNETI
jgi:glycosyltransferase involved in cell wall biosynthesis